VGALTLNVVMGGKSDLGVVPIQGVIRPLLLTCRVSEGWPRTNTLNEELVVVVSRSLGGIDHMTPPLSSVLGGAKPLGSGGKKVCHHL